MSGLRVIGGTARGRRLQAVPGESTRPIMDRVKENLFNIIGQDIVRASLLDLFAGTGSVGIEALSRGADFVRFLDLNRSAVQTVQVNLALTGFANRAEVRQTDAFVHLSPVPDRTFDYIFAAPPQYKGLWLRTLRSVDRNPGWLQGDGWLVVQIDPAEFEELAPSALALSALAEFDRRKYGKTLLLFYRRQGD